LTIRWLQASDADALLDFERANRAWFERHVDPALGLLPVIDEFSS